jgi:hypothetical protein
MPLEPARCTRFSASTTATTCTSFTTSST